MSNLINEKEMAQMIGMSVHWLRRKRWSGGGIPFIKVSDGGAVRYRREDGEKYINGRLCKSTSESSVSGPACQVCIGIESSTRQNGSNATS